MKCNREGCTVEVARRGRALYCSDACRAKVNDRKYTLTHKDELNESRRLKYKTNTEARQGRLASNKRYRQANAERINKHISDYYSEHPEKRRIKRRRYRALKWGVGHSTYRANYIFTRDDWVCQICGRKINRRLKHPNPLSASVDHIIPLSKGGDDSPVNVQASHLRCNVGKQATNKGQLRLFG